MVLKQTENILIHIVIVCSVKILESTAIKYYQKFSIKVKTNGRFIYSYASLDPFIFSP